MIDPPPRNLDEMQRLMAEGRHLQNKLTILIVVFTTLFGCAGFVVSFYVPASALPPPLRAFWTPVGQLFIVFLIPYALCLGVSWFLPHYSRYMAIKPTIQAVMEYEKAQELMTCAEKSANEKELDSAYVFCMHAKRWLYGVKEFNEFCESVCKVKES